MRMKPERGSAIIMLFIAVALFGLLTFAFLQGSRSNLSMMTSERDKALTTQSQDCTNAINMSVKRLQARGCGNLISYSIDGSNAASGAPTDGSCSIYHSNGGGVRPCETPVVDDSCLQTLAIGQSCLGMVYAGISPDGGKRMYTTPSDAGQICWDDCALGYGDHLATGATNSNTGASNSATIAAADAGIAGGIQPHNAASYCENLTVSGNVDWYLPAINELDILIQNKAAIGNFYSNTDWPNTIYWSSTEADADSGRNIYVNVGTPDLDAKYSPGWVRCVRKDP